MKRSGKQAVSQQLSASHLGDSAAYAFKANPETSMVYSWVANDYDGQEDALGIGNQVPHEVAAMFVAPDGKVYTNCDWEENGHNFAQIENGKITNNSAL